MTQRADVEGPAGKREGRSEDGEGEGGDDAEPGDQPAVGGRNRGPGPLQVGYGLTALIRVPQLINGARVCPQVGSAW